jgi:hypothetical protein
VPDTATGEFDGRKGLEHLSKYEQATYCPKCGNKGALTSTHPHPERPGAKVEVWTCENQLCRWGGTGWTIQVNSDGTIPERKVGPLQYPALTPGQETMARDYLKRIQQEETEQSATEQQSDG